MRNKRTLTEGDISKQLLSLTLPMIGGILAIMSMNIVDTFYVAQLGTNELAAMSFTIPVVSILLSLAFGVGIGASSVISRAIGSNQHNLVQAYCTHSLIIALIIALSFAFIGFNSMSIIFDALGAPADLMPLIHDFMDIWFLGSFVVIIPMVGNSAIRAAGNTKLPSLVMISVAIVNMILDPILIFGLLGFPQLGLEGAALSTIISYAIALVFGIYILKYKFDFISLEVAQKHIIDSWSKILKIAVPSVSTNLIAPLSVAIMTWFVAKYSPESVAGFGVATRIESLFLVVVMGLSSIMGPFVGQNWGGKKYDRVFTGMKTAYKFVTLWGLAITITLGLFANPIVSIFSDDPEVIQSATLYLRLIPISYLFLGVIMITSSSANGIGLPAPSLIMSILRLIILFIPIAYLLSSLLGLSGVYIATTVSNVCVGLGALYWYKRLAMAKSSG